MNNRIKEIRKRMGLNQSEFGKRIGISRDTVANIEGGRIEIKDIFIKSICKEFSIDYIWLTTGEGVPFIENDDEIIETIDRIMFGENEFHKNLFKTFAKLDKTELEVLESIINKYIDIANNQNEKADD